MEDVRYRRETREITTLMLTTMINDNDGVCVDKENGGRKK